VEKQENQRDKKRVWSEVSVNSPGNPWSPEELKEGYGGKNSRKRKVLSLE